MNIPILYEDNHLLIVKKPVNMPVQSDQSKDYDLLNRLKQDIKIRYQKPGNVYLGLVHRLDRPVGGVMVFAKDSKAASRLSDMIRRKVLKRSYLAVVRGFPSKKSGVLEDYLYKDRRNNKVFAVSPNHKQAKKAILEYNVLQQSERENLSLLSITLHTGRSHQIRVQLSEMGYPLYGDQKYGQSVNRPGQQIALWSNTLHLPHPTREDDVYIKCTPPDEFPWSLFE
ncbi:23S rRNA pseudouridine1911/1915/1917 synthase [Salinibacillus kushneri]|uniref:RNA pseudouridylate synthase n=1 Tax=Salinibacillus kushneri TaxID=237682 RepID=A0A1I0DP86_9BACI|nr:RluA family pseudouridine synthase [Salinibacillus kushneri]SET34178.1 23S rRNA pseudouridine1911/1915/1917 synthase [Salinibacillus kushneri]